MIKRFKSLRFDSFVRCHNDYGNVRHFNSSSAHLGKCFMTGRIYECDSFGLAFLCFMADFIRADMLGDAAGFFGYHICFSYIIKKRRFAMVNMPQNNHNWRAGYYLAIIWFCY